MPVIAARDNQLRSLVYPNQLKIPELVKVKSPVEVVGSKYLANGARRGFELNLKGLSCGMKGGCHLRLMKPSELIDRQIADLKDWRGEALAKIRRLVHEADPKIVEEWKWSTAVWSHDGLVLGAGATKGKLKVGFWQGASIKDPHKLFNSSLESKKVRVIDLYEGDKIDERVLKDLIRAAVARNTSMKKK